MKAIISKEEYLQLIGLLTLARQHKKMVDDLEKAMKEITGEDNDFSAMSGDYIWEAGRGESVKDLLKDLKIKVNGSKKLHN